MPAVRLYTPSPDALLRRALRRPAVPSVAAALTTVGTTRATTWNTLAAVGPTRATTWNVAAAIVVTRATTWNVKATVGTTRATTWNVTASVVTTRATTWNTLAGVVTTRSTTWNVASALTTVGTTRATTWNVLATITVTRTTTWNVNIVIVAVLTFTPPTVGEASAIRYDWRWPYSRHLHPIQRGVNVFKLNDGTYTQIQPPNNRGVVFAYLGGHEWPVSATEAAALTAAGYGAFVH